MEHKLIGTTMQPLCQQTLSGGFPRELTLPRRSLWGEPPGIVHCSLGNFARAHMVRCSEDVMQLTSDFTWGVASVAFTEPAEHLNGTLCAQQGLYTLVERGTDRQAHRLIGALAGAYSVRRQLEKVLQLLAAPATKVVSLTVTEGGYPVQRDAAGKLSYIQRLTTGETSSQKDVFDVLVEGLRRRLALGCKPFVIMSCDNLEQNGEVARIAMLGAAARAGADEVVRILESENIFPNSMVDRIAPKTSGSIIEHVQQTFGYRDDAPVLCEPFFQWVIERGFETQLPRWHECGAQLSDDVAGFERIKLRVLNAGHSALGYAGYLSNLRHIHTIAQDPLFNVYLVNMLREEVTPLLAVPDGCDISQYQATVVKRFGNEALEDTALRICGGGAAKLQKFILPSISAARAANVPCDRLIFCFAAWCRFFAGIDERGQAISLESEADKELVSPAQQALHTKSIVPILQSHEFLGDLRRDEEFNKIAQRWYEEILERGCRRALEVLEYERGGCS